ncbi:MAG: S1C family serine protease [Dehalococcoidia bacterium]
MTKRWAIAGIGAVVLIAVAAGAGGGFLAAGIADDEPPQPTVQQESTPVVVRSDQESIADVVERVERSAVAVRATGRAGASLGSGVIIDTDGHILTNYHVIQDAQRVEVKLSEGDVLPAEVIGRDPGSDLAVLAIDPTEAVLTPATFGDSDGLRPGDAVFAIGNPFSFEFSVTEGIVSAINRDTLSSPIGRPVPNIIQTDAAINPGNSGGPLFNLAGEVVGINTAIENPTGLRVFVGIGFAIPASRIQRFLPYMLAGKEVKHPQLGIRGMTLSKTLADDLGLETDQGVYVIAVSPGSMADEAGVKGARIGNTNGGPPPGGDVIVGMDGTPVTGIQQLIELIDEHDVGDRVSLEVLDSDGYRSTVQGELGAWSED